MSEDKVSEVIKKLDITIHDFLRYVYTGFVALFAIAISVEDWNSIVLDRIQKLGITFTILAAVALGALIYVVSRNTVVLGWMRFFEWVNSRNCIKNRNLKVDTRFQFFHEKFSLGFLESEDAFHFVRQYPKDATGTTIIAEKLQEQYYRQHSEIHMLYATILVSGVSGVLLIFFGYWSKGCSWLLGGLVLSVVAWIAEFSLSRRECGHLRRAEEKVEKALSEIGISRKTET